MFVTTGILGNKLGMTQIFDQDGNAIPITILRAGPCIVTQIKNLNTDGYKAIQLGYLKISTSSNNRPMQGHLKKFGLQSVKYLREFRIKQTNTFIPGQIIDVTNFKVGQLINVSGKTIGRGFSGNQKRNNFRRGPMAHGSKNHRAPGSIGAGTTPARVFPGKKMAGQYGFSNITIKNLKIVGIDNKKNLILVKGSIPGKPGNLVSITTTD